MSSARVLLRPTAIGPVSQVPQIGGSPVPSDLLIQHNGDSSLFRARSSITLDAPTVVAPGVTFTASDGVAFGRGVRASGTSTFDTVSADTVRAASFAAKTAGGVVEVASGMTVRGDLTVQGTFDTVGARDLTVVDTVVTLGALDADADGLLDLDDASRDGAGIVVAGAPRDMPPGSDAAMYEHSLRWARGDGDFLAGGERAAPHRRPVWKLRGGGLGIVAPDHAAREAQFFFAPLYTATRASLGVYYALGDGRARLVHSFETSPFGSAPPAWRTSARLVAAVGEARERTFTALGAASYSVTSGDVPPGTALDATGVLRGAASAAGTYAFTLTATSADGAAHAERAFEYRVLPPAPFHVGNVAPRFTTRDVALRPIPVGHGLAIQFDAADPYGDVTYSVLAGRVPEGCALTPGGLLTTTGIVRAPGRYAFTLRAFGDASHLFSDKEYTVVVTPAPVPAYTVAGGLVTAVASDALTISLADGAAAAQAAAGFAYVGVRVPNRPDTYWALASVTSTGGTLTARLSGPDIFTPSATLEGAPGAPATLTFHRLAGVGQLRLPFDLGAMNSFDPRTSSTVLNGAEFTAETSFAAAQGSPGACCNGGFARSAATPAHWATRGAFNDYRGPTTTAFFRDGQASVLEVAGEYLDVRFPFALPVSRYTFDPTVADVPSSWVLLALASTGLWREVDARTDVPQPLSETDYGTHVSDVAADRVYDFPAFEARGVRFVVRATTGLVGNTTHVSGFSVVLNPV